MQLNQIKAPVGAHKRKKLLGHGSSSGHGKTSTRGSKGQTSRAGRDMWPGFEGGQLPFIRRFPKRGFNSKQKNKFEVVNISDIDKRFKESSVIDPKALKEKGLVQSSNKLVKILGDGEIKKPFEIKAHAFSKSAIEKITKSGGKTEVLSSVVIHKDRRTTADVA